MENIRKSGVCGSSLWLEVVNRGQNEYYGLSMYPIPHITKEYKKTKQKEQYYDCDLVA